MPRISEFAFIHDSLVNNPFSETGNNHINYSDNSCKHMIREVLR